tara:strand:- start:242 stop:547 length:306 start_codon:yes stop_codon:yes gene_type:complete
MGNCAGSGVIAPEQREANMKIEQEIKKDRKKFEREIKLLLLGAGESGKSTIARQMKILYSTGFTEREREIYREVVTTNVLHGVVVIIRFSRKFGIPLDNEV